MSEVLLITDTHLGLYGSSDSWIEIVKDFFKEVADVCLKRNIKEIFHLGDFFNERKNLNIKVINAAQEIEKILSPFHTYLIAGNHDCYYKNEIKPTSLQIFKDSPSISIITETIQHDNLVLVPWGEIPRGHKGGICLGHFELIGFIMNLKKKCDNGLPVQELMLNKFDMVISGHFHMPQYSENIIYLGAPYQQSFRDSDDIARGYNIFDTKTREMEFHEYKRAPKFIKVNTENIPDREKIEGNYVKLIFEKDYGNTNNEKILRKIYDMKPIRVNPDYSKISVNNEEEIKEDISLIDNDDIFREYIKSQKLPEKLNKKTLDNFVEVVIKEAYE